MEQTAAIIMPLLSALLVAVALYTDITQGKIYNWLTAPALGVGLLLNGVFYGTAGLLSSLGGIGIGLALFLLSAVLGRILGGGDVKVLTALGRRVRKPL